MPSARFAEEACFPHSRHATATLVRAHAGVAAPLCVWVCERVLGVRSVVALCVAGNWVVPGPMNLVLPCRCLA